MQTESILIH